jgi:hypothetical protein
MFSFLASSSPMLLIVDLKANSVTWRSFVSIHLSADVRPLPHPPPTPARRPLLDQQASLSVHFVHKLPNCQAGTYGLLQSG